MRPNLQPDPESNLDRTFYALSHRARRSMLERLALRSYRVTELAKPYDMSLNAVSKHLKVLEAAGLVRRTRCGRVHKLDFDPAPLQSAAQQIEFYRKFWADRLDSLQQFLASRQSLDSASSKPKTDTDNE